MKVFDFDGTIYNGESSVDFSFFMIRHNKRIIRFVPTILMTLAGNKLCLLEKKQLEFIINGFLEGTLDGTIDLTAFVKQFWKEHAHKLNRDILRLIGPDDVIISASPVFLIDGIQGKEINWSETINNIGPVELRQEDHEINWPEPEGQ